MMFENLMEIEPVKISKCLFTKTKLLDWLFEIMQ